MIERNLTELARPSMGLECLAGRARVAVPVSDILEVVEYQVTPPPPLASRFVGGLGSLNGKVVISIAIDFPWERVPPRRVTQGILLRAAHADGPVWAIEVSEVRAFIELATERPLEPSGSEAKPKFISFRQASDGRTVGWVDVAALLAELGFRAQGPAKGAALEAV